MRTALSLQMGLPAKGFPLVVPPCSLYTPCSWSQQIISSKSKSKITEGIMHNAQGDTQPSTFGKIWAGTCHTSKLIHWSVRGKARIGAWWLDDAVLVTVQFADHIEGAQVWYEWQKAKSVGRCPGSFGSNAKYRSECWISCPGWLKIQGLLCNERFCLRLHNAGPHCWQEELMLPCEQPAGSPKCTFKLKVTQVDLQTSASRKIFQIDLNL